MTEDIRIYIQKTISNIMDYLIREEYIDFKVNLIDGKWEHFFNDARINDIIKYKSKKCVSNEIYNFVYLILKQKFGYSKGRIVNILKPLVEIQNNIYNKSDFFKESKEETINSPTNTEFSVSQNQKQKGKNTEKKDLNSCDLCRNRKICFSKHNREGTCRNFEEGAAIMSDISQYDSMY